MTLPYKPTRTFDAKVGDPSTGNAGPDGLKADIDKLRKMFDPDAIHDNGDSGGIHKGNLANESGIVTEDNINDYIIEQGSNAKGNWRKWNSGVMECWGVKDLGSVLVTYSSGAIYTSGASTCCDFPVAFYSLPTFCEVQIYQVGSDQYLWLLPHAYNSLSRTHTWYFLLGRASSEVFNNVKVSYHAIGRWKE